jgi:5-methyltetrahydrofolate--homocysteine methyltransferase
MGVSPSAFAQSFNGAGLYALGINCGKSLEDNLAALQMLNEATTLPIWFKPNAGLPKISSSGQTEYDVTPDLMAKHVPSWIANGARFIGGCGTSPAHLKEISTAVHATIE